jgi:hypothetical protein
LLFSPQRSAAGHAASAASPPDPQETGSFYISPDPAVYAPAAPPENPKFHPPQKPVIVKVKTLFALFSIT